MYAIRSYYDDAGQVCECKARGRFRNDRVVPLPGDRVLFTTNDGTYGFIEEICERRNELSRPRVANIDQASKTSSTSTTTSDASSASASVSYNFV